MSSNKGTEREFNSAAARVAQAKLKVADNVKLELYALYKQATVGPCNVARPKFFDFVGKAKWDVWQSKGSMSSDKAKLSYIDLVRHVLGDDRLTKSSFTRSAAYDSIISRSSFLAPAVSRMSFQQEERNMNSIWDLACDNEIELIRKLLDSGTVTVDARDQDGCSALHLACDRGHAKLAEMLLDVYKANVNLQDDMGCTPLHYAVCCDRPEIAHILMRHGANPRLHDKEGHLPISSAGVEVAAVFNHYGN